LPYRLEEWQAKEMIIVSVLNVHWLTVCHEANLSQIERVRLWKNAVLNPYCFEGWDT